MSVNGRGASGPRAYARSGLRPGPCGGCAPATCSKVKNFPKRRKHAAEDVGKLDAVATTEISNQKGGLAAELRSSFRLIVRL